MIAKLQIVLHSGSNIRKRPPRAPTAMVLRSGDNVADVMVRPIPSIENRRARWSFKSKMTTLGGGMPVPVSQFLTVELTPKTNHALSAEMLPPNVVLSPWPLYKGSNFSSLKFQATTCSRYWNRAFEPSGRY